MISLNYNFPAVPEVRAAFSFFSLILLIQCICLSSLSGQIYTDSILVDNHQRTFHFTSSAKPGSCLVFVLHGSGGSGPDLIKRTSKLIELTKSEPLLLVYPDGYKKYWNECRKAASSLANQENIDENKFFSGLIEYFKRRFQIDESKVFAVGTSGGGHMSYKLALTMPDKFRAITAIIANLPDQNNMDCSEAGKPLAVMIINGTADPLNRYEGGMMESSNFTMGVVRSTDLTFQYWANLAGYHGQPVKTLLADVDPADQKTIERYTYHEAGKPEIVLLKVIGGKHDYPNDIDVHVEAWEFFKRQIK